MATLFTNSTVEREHVSFSKTDISYYDGSSQYMLHLSKDTTIVGNRGLFQTIMEQIAKEFEREDLS